MRSMGSTVRTGDSRCMLHGIGSGSDVWESGQESINERGKVHVCDCAIALAGSPSGHAPETAGSPGDSPSVPSSRETYDNMAYGNSGPSIGCVYCCNRCSDNDTSHGTTVAAPVPYKRSTDMSLQAARTFLMAYTTVCNPFTTRPVSERRRSAGRNRAGIIQFYTAHINVWRIF